MKSLAGDAGRPKVARAISVPIRCLRPVTSAVLSPGTSMRAGAAPVISSQDNTGTVLSALSGRRVLFLLSSLELGGAERQAIQLASFLRAAGAQVQVWGLSPPGMCARLCDQRQLPWRSLEPPLKGGVWRKCLGLMRFIRAVRRFRAEILLSYTMAPNVLCGVTWRFTGARLCVWNQRDEGRGRVGRRVENWAVRQIPLFVSNSKHGADFLTGTLGANPERVFVVPNGVELPQPRLSRGAWVHQNQLPPTDLLACMLGNLTEFKDHVTLLRAWRLVLDDVRSRGSGATLLLAGRFGNMTQKLRALAAELGLGTSVRFLGPVSDVSSLLKAMDLGVFSSRQEGCPNGVLECMAAGLAVAATDIPGIREALGDQAGELLSAPGNAQALAANIQRLMLDASLRATWGVANQARVERFFGTQRMCSQMAELIVTHLQSR